MSSGYLLTIDTYKTNSNAMVTMARAHSFDTGGRMYVHTLSRDFSQRLASEQRHCTQKAVEGQHANVLLWFDQLLVSVLAWYQHPDRGGVLVAPIPPFD
jgi:hypothetical protein